MTSFPTDEGADDEAALTETDRVEAVDEVLVGLNSSSEFGHLLLDVLRVAGEAVGHGKGTAVGPRVSVAHCLGEVLHDFMNA